MHVWIWLPMKCSIIRDTHIWGTRRANIWIPSVEDPCLISSNFFSVRRIIKRTIFSIIIFFRRMLCKNWDVWTSEQSISHTFLHREASSAITTMYTMTLFLYRAFCCQGTNLQRCQEFYKLMLINTL